MTLEEFFPLGFLEKVMVNPTSCSNPKQKEEEGGDKQENPPSAVDKTLTALEALSTRMD